MTCEKCGSSAGGPGVEITGKFTCWRTDCPGRAPEPPKLKVVK